MNLDKILGKTFKVLGSAGFLVSSYIAAPELYCAFNNLPVNQSNLEGGVIGASMSVALAGLGKWLDSENNENYGESK